MSFEIHYTRPAGGVPVAYGHTGSGSGLPLIVLGWQSIAGIQRQQHTLPFLELLGSARELVYADVNTTTDAEQIWSRVTIDLAAIADHAGFPAFALLAAYRHVSLAIKAAAELPARVQSEYAATSTVQSFESLIDADWETYTDALGMLFAGRHEPEIARDIAEGYRTLFAPEDLTSAVSGVDRIWQASSLLPQTQCPTLVAHRRDARVPPLEIVQNLAAGLPNAALRMLEGDSVLPDAGRQEESAEVITSFLRQLDAPVAADTALSSDATLRTILFTDVENSTDLVVQHGDTKYRELLADHERLVREALAEHGGNEIKTMGDGFMCWFSSASSAIDAAAAMQRKITDHYGDGLRIRIGIHAGSPSRRRTATSTAPASCGPRASWGKPTAARSWSRRW